MKNEMPADRYTLAQFSSRTAANLFINLSLWFAVYSIVELNYITYRTTLGSFMVC